MPFCNPINTVRTVMLTEVMLFVNCRLWQLLWTLRIWFKTYRQNQRTLKRHCPMWIPNSAQLLLNDQNLHPQCRKLAKSAYPSWNRICPSCRQSSHKFRQGHHWVVGQSHLVLSHFLLLLPVRLHSSRDQSIGLCRHLHHLLWFPLVLLALWPPITSQPCPAFRQPSLPPAV